MQMMTGKVLPDPQTKLASIIADPVSTTNAPLMGSTLYARAPAVAPAPILPTPPLPGFPFQKATANDPTVLD